MPYEYVNAATLQLWDGAQWKSQELQRDDVPGNQNLEAHQNL